MHKRGRENGALTIIVFNTSNPADPLLMINILAENEKELLDNAILRRDNRVLFPAVHRACSVGMLNIDHQARIFQAANQLIIADAVERRRDAIRLVAASEISLAGIDYSSIRLVAFRGDQPRDAEAAAGRADCLIALEGLWPCDEPYLRGEVGFLRAEYREALILDTSMPASPLSSSAGPSSKDSLQSYGSSLLDSPLVSSPSEESTRCSRMAPACFIRKEAIVVRLGGHVVPNQNGPPTAESKVGLGIDVVVEGVSLVGRGKSTGLAGGRGELSNIARAVHTAMKYRC